MDASQIRRLKPELERYLARFNDCFARREPAQRMATYVQGQLSDLPRKSVEPIALASGQAPRSLQQFLSLHKWDDELMRDRVQQIVAQEHAHPESVGIFDETGYPKKGQKTPGVQRQWCGASGKRDNSTLTVHLGYAAGDFQCLLDGELYVPQSWAEDRPRCRDAGIPEEMTYRPKWQIALELLDRATANGVRLQWLTFDEAYGMVPAFLFELDDRGQRYVAEVPRHFAGWLRKPELLQKEHHARPNMGRPRKFPRLKAKSPRVSSVANLASYSPAMHRQAWERFHVKDTDKGPVVWEAKAAPFYLKRDELPTWPHLLIVARHVLTGEVKYFVSNAPAGTPLEVLLRVAFTRWHVERCFQDEKGQLGLDHFEVRNYRSLRRHLILSSVSHLFLAKMREHWREKKHRADRLPATYRGVGIDPVALDDGAGPEPLPTARGGENRLRPSKSKGLATLP